MKRRDFFRFTGGSALVAGAAGLAEPSQASNFPTSAVDRTNLDSNYPPAAPSVAAEFAALLLWLRDRGWSQVLRRIAGFDLNVAIAGDDTALFAELQFDNSVPLAEFGGKRAIQPGDPAMSLLYHVLAASEAIFPELSATAYPGPEQIDALENYIFDRMNLTKATDLEMAVFAYEYRQAFKTPHQLHADIVYARAGISRTGTHNPAYDVVQREYRAVGTATVPMQGCATVPARFGLFLARRLSHREIDRIAGNSADDRYQFLLPICKLVSGGRMLGGRSIQFQQSHRDEKLARLMQEVGDPGAGFTLAEPPFLRKSMSEDGPQGGKIFDDQTYPLVSIRAMPGSARIFPEPRPIVRPAMQNGRLARFEVPAKTEGALSNRRYTSLKLVQDRRAEGIDAFFADYLFRGGRPTTGFRAPRNAPSFVNIRALIEKDETITYLSRSEEHLTKIADGGYDAALFEDGLCDGCVTAEIIGTYQSDVPDGIAFDDNSVLPAISFVAAPDFFPRVDPLDLEQYDNMFLEGGTESASGLRRPPNPLVELPNRSGSSAFPLVKREPIAETMTAVVSRPANKGRTYKARGYVRSSALNTLTDTVSNVFFPGWDITYSNVPNSDSDDTFLASFGLGSPFPEDMKLCAAANGMWAGASPDASRTFYPSLERLPFRGRPATAVPLLDFELGYHPASPAKTEWNITQNHERGWDGEHGPFVLLNRDIEGKARVSIDCADILLSDYVRNAVEGWMDLGRMQNLHNRDIIDRMVMLKTCIAALPRGGRVATSDMWLVSAEQVADWRDGAQGLGVPGGLAPRNLGRLAAAPDMNGAGYLYLFAKCSSPDKGTATTAGRRRFAARRLYLCQGDAQGVRYARLDPDQDEPGPLKWSRIHAMRYR